MSFQKYFSALFVAAALSASPMIGMAGDDSDHRDQPTVDMSREQQREPMMTDQQQQESGSDESLAQFPGGSDEPLASGYCFTESVIDESTGEIVALREICEEIADVA
jgi:hypothetical protein